MKKWFWSQKVHFHLNPADKTHWSKISHFAPLCISITSGSGPRIPPQAMPLNTFGGGNGPDGIMSTASEQRENEKQSLFGTTNIADFSSLGSKSAPVTSGNSPTQSLSVRSPANDHLRLTAKYEKIDRIATWLFPIIFLLFNVIYWSYYLLLSDALQEIW